MLIGKDYLQVLLTLLQLSGLSVVLKQNLLNKIIQYIRFLLQTEKIPWHKTIHDVDLNLFI